MDIMGAICAQLHAPPNIATKALMGRPGPGGPPMMGGHVGTVQ